MLIEIISSAQCFISVFIDNLQINYATNLNKVRVKLGLINKLTYFGACMLKIKWVIKYKRILDNTCYTRVRLFYPKIL